MTQFSLPLVIRDLVNARNNLRAQYEKIELNFTLDGNLVGDLGEAIAVELFDITLTKGNCEGYDGIALDGRTVQIKATGTGRGPVFRNTKMRADHLLFFDLDLESLKGDIVFNGPETIALQFMPDSWVGQRPISPKKIRQANKQVKPEQRLLRIK